MIQLSLILAVALSAGNAEFERSANEVAANIALGRLKVETEANGLRDGVLAEKMLLDPATFKVRAEAEKQCREIYAKELQAQFESEVKAIEERIGGVDLPSELDGATVAEKLFPKAFEVERKAACQAQVKKIAVRVKPDEAELEAEDDRAIREKLVHRVAEVAGEVVFDENLDYISQKIVDPLIADARKEQQRQREYLMRTRADAYAPSMLKRELEANLRKNVEERQEKCVDPVRAWGVFPKTLEATLPTAVERRVNALVAKRTNEVPITLTDEMMRSEIEKEPARHRKAKESERIFFEIATKSVMESAINKAIEEAPAAEREEFATFVRTRAASEELRKETTSRLRRELLPRWRALRSEITKRESSRLWPTLMDGTWYPPAEVADRIIARSDSAAVLKDWRNVDDFECLKAQATFEESDEDADKSLIRAFDLARKAIAAQNEIVEKVHPEVLADAKELSKGFFSSKPNLSKVIEILTQAVEEEWTEHRVGMLWKKGAEPKNVDDQHTDLFPSVHRHIELLARQILEELEQPEQSESKMPEETSSESEAESEEEELCTIEFELFGGEVIVRAKRGETVIAERRTKAKARDFENAVREVGAIVGRKVLKFQ